MGCHIHFTIHIKTKMIIGINISQDSFIGIYVQVNWLLSMGYAHMFCFIFIQC